MHEADSLNARFNTIYPQEIIYNAVQVFGNRLAVLTRFKPADIVILHMLSAFAPRIPVLTLHHDANADLMEAITSRLSLNLVRIAASSGADGVPLNRSLTQYDAWLVGQSAAASTNVPVLAYTQASHRIRIAPLAHWSHDTIQSYLQEHQLPFPEESSRGLIVRKLPGATAGIR